MNINVRMTAAEQHIRDLEDSRAALAKVMGKNDLVARVAALEAKLASLGRLTGQK